MIFFLTSLDRQDPNKTSCQTGDCSDHTVISNNLILSYVQTYFNNTETAMKILGQSICQNCACNHWAAGEQPETCTVIESWGFPKAESNILFNHQTQLGGKYSLLWEMYPSEQRNSCDRDRTGNYCKYYTESHHLKQCKTNPAIKKKKKIWMSKSFWTDMDPSSGVPLSLLQRLFWKM